MQHDVEDGGTADHADQSQLDRRQFLRKALFVGAVAAVAPGSILRPDRASAAEMPVSTSVAVPRPEELTHSLLRWTGPQDVALQVRNRVGSTWSQWADADLWADAAHPARGHSSGLITTAGASEVEARSLRGAPVDLRIELMNAGTQSAATVAEDAQILADSYAAAGVAVPQPYIISRAYWGANESLRRGYPDFAPISKLIVHHTVTSNNDVNTAATVRGIYQFHTTSNGWDDIGYNFLIDNKGRIYEGRYSRPYLNGEVPTGESISGVGVIGAHAFGVNAGSCGIAMLGTFSSQAPTEVALNALVWLLAWKADRHDIDPQGSTPVFNAATNQAVVFPNISGHRHSFQTECPGSRLAGALPVIRDRVASRIQGAGGSAAIGTAGYWVATRDGQVLTFGAPSHGSMAGRSLTKPIVGMAPTPSRGGYWLTASDGGIFAFGDAEFHGSMGGRPLNQPMVGMAPTPSGEGYWTVASDGGVFAFGDAKFFGSMGGRPLNRSMVGIASTPSGQGYWTVASDGGIFAFGDARFFGSTGSFRLNAPIVGMTPTPLGNGYWLVASDGGIFAFGDAGFYGSVPSSGLGSYAGAVSIDVSPGGKGYVIASQDGLVSTFGDAVRVSDRRRLSQASAAVAIAAWSR